MLAYDVVQILQVAGAIRPPLDEILIFATSLSIVVPFVLAKWTGAQRAARGRESLTR